MKNAAEINIIIAERLFEFKSTEDKVLMKWLRVVKERAEVISKVQVEELVNFNKDIMTVQNLFPKNCMSSKQNKQHQKRSKLKIELTFL